MKPLLTKLTTWKKTDEDEEFVDKAIDSLYKKLKTKNGAIEDLQFAINNPHLQSKCVTIPRSLDGRLQVSHRKGLPHVIYCRIFRWPDLQTPHELRPLDLCEFPFSAKQSEVCVNPYHYERVDIPILPPVLVPKCVEFSQAHSLIHLSSSPHAQIPQSSSYQYNTNLNYTNCYYATTSISGDGNNGVGRGSSSGISCLTSGNNNNNNVSYTTCSSISSSNSSGSRSPPNLMEESSSSESFVSNFSPTTAEIVGQAGSRIKQTFITDTTDHSQSIHYQEPTHWCSVVYYELNSRIGEIFYASCNDIFIDGYTNPCSSYGRRFCLGMFSNINRSPTIENCRKHIGKGIHLYNDNGDIYVENLSECPIFIQSRNCNHDRGFHANTVCKLPSAYSLRIFQSKLFAELLKDSIEQGYDAVYDLSHMCLIKLSFVKGWGADYYRQDVSSCPCWIEIRLNGPFQWLDKVLKEMGSSNNPVTSVS